MVFRHCRKKRIISCQKLTELNESKGFLVAGFRHCNNPCRSVAHIAKESIVFLMPRLCLESGLACLRHDKNRSACLTNWCRQTEERRINQILIKRFRQLTRILSPGPVYLLCNNESEKTKLFVASMSANNSSYDLVI